MTVRTEHIATELKRIRTHCADDIAILMTPLVHAIEAGQHGAPGGLQKAELAAMAGSLAQVAAQAGDVETAVAIASLQAEIEAIGPADLPPAAAEGSDAAAPAGRGAAPRSGQRSLAAEYPLPLLLGLLAAAAVSYGVHVWTQARFAPGSLIGWLLSASTTLLSVALTLRLGSLLAVRVPRRRLTIFSATVAGLACMLALTSFLIHRAEFVFPPTDPADTVAARAEPGAPAAPPEAASGPTAATAGEAPISMWWLGDATPATGDAPATALMDADAVDAADAAARPPVPASAAREPPRVAPRVPPPRAPAITERYAGLLDRQVRLLDNQGETHLGTLTGVSKDSVTLLTEVMMFGQPVPAHRQFLHSAIRSLELR